MVIINFDTPSHVIPHQRLKIKILIPDVSNPTVRESQSPTKFRQIGLKISIQKLKFNINRAVLKPGIPIHDKGIQKFPTQVLIN